MPDILKKYQNPAVTKEKKDGMARYFLQVPTGQITLFEYQQASVKPTVQQELGSGMYGAVTARRNPHAHHIANKALSIPLDRITSEDRMIFFNQMYAFIRQEGLSRNFNIPIYTTPSKQLQRRIYGTSLDDPHFITYVRQHPEIKQGDWIRMKNTFIAAYTMFSHIYRYSDFHFGNIMYDQENRCLILIDFDDVYLRASRCEDNLARDIYLVDRAITKCIESAFVLPSHNSHIPLILRQLLASFKR